MRNNLLGSNLSGDDDGDSHSAITTTNIYWRITPTSNETPHSRVTDTHFIASEWKTVESCKQIISFLTRGKYVDLIITNTKNGSASGTHIHSIDR